MASVIFDPRQKMDYMASVPTIIETKESAKILIKKNYLKPMASVLLDPRQKMDYMTLVC